MDYYRLWRRDTSLFERPNASFEEMIVSTSKGFTLVEMMVVLALMALLATTTLIYGSRWRNDYKFRAFHNNIEAGIKAVRMKAVAAGRNSVLIVTDAYVNNSCVVIPSVKFSADYSLFPCTAQSGVSLPFGGVAASITSSDVWYYFLYNPKVYSFTPASTYLGFNGRGTPIYFASQSLRITSPALKKTVTITITPLGKTETHF